MTDHIIIDEATNEREIPLMILFAEIAAIDVRSRRILLKGGGEIDTGRQGVRLIFEGWKAWLAESPAASLAAS